MWQPLALSPVPVHTHMGCLRMRGVVRFTIPGHAGMAQKPPPPESLSNPMIAVVAPSLSTSPPPSKCLKTTDLRIETGKHKPVAESWCVVGTIRERVGMMNQGVDNA